MPRRSLLRRARPPFALAMLLAAIGCAGTPGSAPPDPGVPPSGTGAPPADAVTPASDAVTPASDPAHSDTALPVATGAPGAPALRLEAGSHAFWFHDARGNADRPILVRYHLPADHDAETPIVFVMHGASRDGPRYFGDFEPEAASRGFALFVPEFGDSLYPGSRWYNLGHVYEREEPEAPLPDSMWTYTAVEHLFDVVRQAMGSRRTTFRIYGHSAGSQFVHRFLMLRPEAPVERAVLANAGWYTMPVDSIRWPYGLGGAPVDAAGMAGRFALPVTVLLGDQDIDTTQSSLRRTPEAMAQGPHRFARGHAFFETARREAERMGARFVWQLDTVPGAHHSNALMTPAAAEILGWD